MATQAKKMTYADFLEMEIPEGDTAIYELIHGEIVKRASPNTPHQRVSLKLIRYLDPFIESNHLGELFHAPYDVYFDEENAGIQPDLLFVSNERRHIIKENNGIVGVPDLIVEIISKGTMDKDRVLKKDLYEQFRVPEYWIADPRNCSIEVYRLEGDRYGLFSFAAEEGMIKSAVLPGLEVDVAGVFPDFQG
ncbi:MAG: Uma2 family endonuclease [Lewinellaceae bacterium]|nr:Uma2 family endonuclease [Lewinella sp.]MCB9281660.1 Uma2 family endonuclease [Lewinellaceae bacterium]